MKLKPRYLLNVFLIFIAAAVVAGFWGTVYGPPIIRTHYYWELVGDFQRAQNKAEIKEGDKKTGWDFQIQIPGSKTTAQVSAPSSAGIATITIWLAVVKSQGVGLIPMIWDGLPDFLSL